MTDLPPRSPWPIAPQSLPSIDGYAQVFRFSLDLDEERTAALHALLEADDRARAARFYTAENRSRYIAAQGQMREILAGYLSLAPAQVRLQRAAQGKPFLPGGALRFNLSHSGGLALLAVCKTQEVGIDLEDTRRIVDYTTIAQRFFAPAEAQAIAALPAAEQRLAFFRCWTRKEAYIKAHGGGMAVPLASFSVTVAAGETPRIIGVEPGWQLYALEPGADYVGALVTLGALSGVRCWDWNPG